MGAEKEKLEATYKEILAQAIGVEQIVDFPITLNVEPDVLPDVERWRNE